MGIYPFLIGSAIVPSLLLIWYFHSRDVYPEPQGMVWATFFLGVATVPIILLVDWPISLAIAPVTDPFGRGFLEAFLVAAMVEEGCKYVVVTQFCMRSRHFDEPMDGIVYGAVASLGFATLENILYVAHQGDVKTAVMRAVTAVPGHAFMGAIMGYYVGQAKFAAREHKAKLLTKGYLFPFLLHGAYDFPLLTSSHIVQRDGASGLSPELALAVIALFALTIGVLVFEWVWAVKLVGRLRRDQQALAARTAWRGLPVAQPYPYPYAPPPYPYGAPAPYPAPYPPPAPYAPPTPYAAPTPYVPYPAPGPHAPYPAPPPHPGYGAPAPYPPAPPPSPPRDVPRAEVVPARGGAAAWTAVVFGGLMACAGGMVSIAFLFTLATDSASRQDPGSTVLGVFSGLLPLGLGVALFLFGLRRLSPRARG